MLSVISRQLSISLRTSSRVSPTTERTADGDGETAGEGEPTARLLGEGEAASTFEAFLTTLLSAGRAFLFEASRFFRKRNAPRPNTPRINREIAANAPAINTVRKPLFFTGAGCTTRSSGIRTSF